MEQFWKWLARIAWIVAIVSFLKGWLSSMEGIKLFWNNLTPWQFIFFLSLAVILFESIRFFFRLNGRVNNIDKQAYRHDHNIGNIQGLATQIKTLEKEPANRVAAIDQLSKRIDNLEQDCYRVVRKRTEVVEPEESSTRKLDEKIREKVREKTE